MINRDYRIPERADAVTQHGRLLFRYYKDRYAVMMLEDLLQPRQPIRSLREGRFGRLLDRPSIKALVASKGDGWLDRDDLLMLWPYETETYVVTFATWGSAERRDQRWHQISRPRRQLVLQLNFPRLHDIQYRRLIANAKDMPFAQDYHPINENGRITMAWARIDIDFSSGEALIEEVQSDWIRNVLWDAARGYGYYGESPERDRLKLYAESVLAPHTAMWSEAVLAAALHLLIAGCGISRVWYHHYDTGWEVKKMSWCGTPRSLYTDLPKRFCFELTNEPPAFILPWQPRRLRRKLERREGRFWRFDALRLPARQ